MQAQLNANPNLNTNKWTTRDYITLAIFNVVMLVILTLVTAFTHALSYLIGGGAVALFNGAIYMAMANKINKRGIIFFSSVIMGLFYLAMGFVHFLITMAAFGILCELVMWGKNAYTSTFRNSIGFSLYYVGWCLCGVVPLIFFKEHYMATLTQNFTQKELDKLLVSYETPGLVLLMCFIAIAGGVAGCYIGSLLLKKHVKKAKLV
jgi:energy-coupling factor transport system substrate-specific component